MSIVQVEKVAGDIMSPGIRCVHVNETIQTAAEKMAVLGVDALPVCDADQRLRGMLTERDIVVKVVAAGRPVVEVRAGDLVQAKPVTVDVDDSASQVLEAWRTTRSGGSRFWTMVSLWVSQRRRMPPSLLPNRRSASC